MDEYYEREKTFSKEQQHEHMIISLAGYKKTEVCHLVEQVSSCGHDQPLLVSQGQAHGRMQPSRIREKLHDVRMVSINVTPERWPSSVLPVWMRQIGHSERLVLVRNAIVMVPDRIALHREEFQCQNPQPGDDETSDGMHANLHCLEKLG